MEKIKFATDNGRLVPIRKYNENHDSQGKFASGGSSPRVGDTFRSANGGTGVGHKFAVLGSNLNGGYTTVHLASGMVTEHNRDEMNPSSERVKVGSQRGGNAPLITRESGRTIQTKYD